jgi:hypothetical protein
MKPVAALVPLAGLLSAVLSSPATAQQTPLKIGALSDFSSVYSGLCVDAGRWKQPSNVHQLDTHKRGVRL